MKTLLAINGSAGTNTSNERLLQRLAWMWKATFHFEWAPDLKALPHFDPVLSVENPPEKVIAVREKIAAADGVVICTPEYVFSVPSGLKNLIEWCVATTVFSGKPVGLITASASGEKGHAELQVLLQTLGAVFIPETTLLISGIKAKIKANGMLESPPDVEALNGFEHAFRTLVERSAPLTG